MTRINLETGKFVADGQTYTVEETLTIERYAEFQILEKELAYGLTVKGLFEKLQALWNMQNKMKFAEASVALNDLMRGVSKLPNGNQRY